MALVRGAERTLLAHPGAADHFGLSDLNSCGILRTLRAREGERERVVVYVEGFFAIHSWDVTVRLAEVRYKLQTDKFEHQKFPFDEDEHICQLVYKGTYKNTDSNHSRSAAKEQIAPSRSTIAGQC